MTDLNKFDVPTQAKYLAAKEFNKTLGHPDQENLYLLDSDFRVVWSAKVLKNWKAIVSTDAVEGLMYDITHNGEKNETYVDTYRKSLNNVHTH